MRNASETLNLVKSTHFKSSTGANTCGLVGKKKKNTKDGAQPAVVAEKQKMKKGGNG